MTRLIDHLEKRFDQLYAHASNETDEHGIYADTRSVEGHFSIRSTQSGVSTYRAYEENKNGSMPGTVQPEELDAFDCEDPLTCPDCEPVMADD